MEIKPAGEDGERYILTTVDVAARYAYFRATPTRDALCLAELLLDVFLDMGSSL